MLRRFIIIAALSMAFALPTKAAEVVKILKKSGHAVIDEGSNQGVAPGNKVCFYHKSKRRGCFKVRSAKANQSLVKLSKKARRYIKVGMEAKIFKSKTTKSQPSSTGLRGYYLLTFLGPVGFQKLGYTYDSSNPSSASALFEDHGTAAYSGSGFGLEFSFTATQMTHALGLRLRDYRGFIADADYDKSNNDGPLFSSKQALSSYGAYYDLYYMNIDIGLELGLGAGLDLDMATATYKADVETIGTVYDAKASLMVVSLRLPLMTTLWLGPIGVYATPTLLLPLFQSGPNISGESIDSHSADSAEQLKAAWDPKKTSFGFEMQMGGIWRF